MYIFFFLNEVISHLVQQMHKTYAHKKAEILIVPFNCT